MNAAHNEFVAGTNYTDSLTAVAADGMAQVVTVTIAGLANTGTSLTALPLGLGLIVAGISLVFWRTRRRLN